MWGAEMFNMDLMQGVLCWSNIHLKYVISYINLKAPAEIIHASTSSSSIFLKITSVSHLWEYLNMECWRVKSLSPSWTSHKGEILCPPFSPLSLHSVLVLYVPVKQNKKRRQWQHHLESALLKSEERGGGAWFPVDFNQVFYSTGATLSAAPRQQLWGCLKMPTQVPMGTKTQVLGSLWSVLMIDKAGLFIACAVLCVWKLKRAVILSSICSLEAETETPQQGWDWLNWRKNVWWKMCVIAQSSLFF